MNKEKMSNAIGWPMAFVFAVMYFSSILEANFKWFGWEPSLILTIFAIGTVGILVGATLNLIYEFKEDKKEKTNN